jgi:hypothetical protein
MHTHWLELTDIEFWWNLFELKQQMYNIRVKVVEWFDSVREKKDDNDDEAW